MDAYQYVSYCLDMLMLVSFNSFTTFKEAGLNETELLALLNQLNSLPHSVVSSFSLCLYGLQQRYKAKEFRSSLRFVWFLLSVH